VALIFVNIIVAQIWLIATIFGLLMWKAIRLSGTAPPVVHEWTDEDEE